MIKTKEELIKLVPNLTGEIISKAKRENNETIIQQEKQLHYFISPGYESADGEINSIASFFTGTEPFDRLTDEEAIELYNKLNFNDEFIEKL